MEKREIGQSVSSHFQGRLRGYWGGHWVLKELSEILAFLILFGLAAQHASGGVTVAVRGEGRGPDIWLNNRGTFNGQNYGRGAKDDKASDASDGVSLESVGVPMVPAASSIREPMVPRSQAVADRKLPFSIQGQTMDNLPQPLRRTPTNVGNSAW